MDKYIWQRHEEARDQPWRGSTGTTEEVRLAMAWNGGVGLAIRMGGAAVELDAARRAHLGQQREEGNERSVYLALTQALDRELVIDILAGPTARGINGALLVAVITPARGSSRPSRARRAWRPARLPWTSRRRMSRVPNTASRTTGAGRSTRASAGRRSARSSSQPTASTRPSADTA